MMHESYLVAHTFTTDAMHMLLDHMLLVMYYHKSVLTVALYTCLWYNIDPELE